MRTFRRGRKSMRETALANRAAHQFYAAMTDKPIMPGMGEVPPEPKKRAGRTDDGKPRERDVLKAIIEALRAHPAVGCVWRMQSGVFQDGERMIRVGHTGMPDLIGFLRGSGKFFAIEVKSETGRLTDAQTHELAIIKARGGISGVARSIDDALHILTGVSKTLDTM